MAVARYNTRELTKYLRELAVEAESMDDSGDVITRAKALALLIWKKALGYRGTVVTSAGSKEVDHAPEAWAMQLIYDRLEGRVAQAATEEAGKQKAADRVSDLSRSRLNAMAGTAVGVKPPPKIKPPSKKEE